MLLSFIILAIAASIVLVLILDLEKSCRKKPDPLKAGYTKPASPDASSADSFTDQVLLDATLRGVIDGASTTDAGHHHDTSHHAAYPSTDTSSHDAGHSCSSHSCGSHGCGGH